MQPVSDPTSVEIELTQEARETALRLGVLIQHLFLADRGRLLRAIEESGLSFTECKTLLLLAGDVEREGRSGRELADELGVSEGTVSRAVDRLVEEGYAVRREDPADRRVRPLAITQTGETVVATILEARLAGLEQFSAGLTAAERRKLDGALAKLLERPDLAQRYESLAQRYEQLKEMRPR